jgi:hypothetical protein
MPASQQPVRMASRSAGKEAVVPVVRLLKQRGAHALGVREHALLCLAEQSFLHPDCQTYASFNLLGGCSSTWWLGWRGRWHF